MISTKGTKGENKMKKTQMFTNEKGVSYYQRGKRYFSNTGWLEREINQLTFEREIKSK